jgi:poly-gamma-glutamate capsule biosynthesis protein CapA/YwtB (metallophosphatase superfamily)
MSHKLRSLCGWSSINFYAFQASSAMNNDQPNLRTRREFLKLAGITAVALGMTKSRPAGDMNEMIPDQSLSSQATSRDSQTITLFLCGDVMTGRGIDQVLPYPGNPQIHEPYMISAKGYVTLAEEANGPIPKPVDFAYIWGDALKELRRTNPDVRIINLETAVTASPEFWAEKGIHYRMQPRNIPCISAAKIDCCVLANNHVLDWGYAGLTETLTSLADANLKVAGAGRNLSEAEVPAIIEVTGKGRLLVFAFGDESSGIPWLWGARSNRPGVNLLPDLSGDTVRRIAKRISGLKQKDDWVVASIHWGRNWGYEVSSAQREFAHRLIDQTHVDVVHGHSSHHPKGIEVYKGKPILFGCGDFLNDYEGIPGYEGFRGDLTLMYFVTLDLATGKLVSLIMTPMQIKRFRLNYAHPDDVHWLQQVMDRESRSLGTRIELANEGRLALSVRR